MSGKSQVSSGPWEGNTPLQALNGLLKVIGVAAEDTGGKLSITGADPVVNSRYRLGTAVSAALLAQGAAIAAIWKMRSNRGQDVSVDARRAVVPGIRTCFHLLQNGHQVPVHPVPMYPSSGFFRTRDDRQFYILRNMAFTEKILGALDVLDCSFNPVSMQKAVSQWKADDLETVFAERRLVGATARTREEWLQMPQGRILAAVPPVEIDKIGDSEPEPFGKGIRPLSGIKALDFTHVLAGPVSTRTLAEQGAQVLHISAARQPDLLNSAMDTGWGRRSAFLDIDLPENAAKARALAKTADIFSHSWRPGSLDRRGFGPQELAHHRPGIIYVSISCYGSDGPWSDRGGYDPIGQVLSGLSIDEGSAEAPVIIPAGALNDYLTGYLAAAGVLGALVRRAREGGSYHVKASLARTSMWVQELGRLPESQWPKAPLSLTPPDEHMIEMEGPYGRLRSPAPITQFSETRAFWHRAPQPHGASLPQWESD